MNALGTQPWQAQMHGEPQSLRPHQHLTGQTHKVQCSPLQTTRFLSQESQKLGWHQGTLAPGGCTGREVDKLGTSGKARASSPSSRRRGTQGRQLGRGVPSGTQESRECGLQGQKLSVWQAAVAGPSGRSDPAMYESNCCSNVMIPFITSAIYSFQ